MNVACCQVEVPATDWSLTHWSPTECGMSWVWSRNLNNEKVWAQWGCRATKKKIYIYICKYCTEWMILKNCFFNYMIRCSSHSEARRLLIRTWRDIGSSNREMKLKSPLAVRRLIIPSPFCRYSVRLIFTADEPCGRRVQNTGITTSYTPWSTDVRPRNELLSTGTAPDIDTSVRDIWQAERQSSSTDAEQATVYTQSHGAGCTFLKNTGANYNVFNPWKTKSKSVSRHDSVC